MFNVGDKVRVRTWEEMLELPNVELREDEYGEFIQFDGEDLFFAEGMKEFCNQIMTVSKVNMNGSVELEEDVECGWGFTEFMIEKKGDNKNEN